MNPDQGASGLRPKPRYALRFRILELQDGAPKNEILLTLDGHSDASWDNPPDSLLARGDVAIRVIVVTSDFWKTN